jgi:hypothetical protein
MDQGRQGRDQVDAAVVQDVRGQRRAARTSCAGLQSWQLSPLQQKLLAGWIERQVAILLGKVY